MDKTKIKYLVGIYAAAMTIMGMLVPVPIVASVAQTFPGENIAAIQMIIGVIPLMMAISAMVVSSQLATRVSKKHTTLVCHVVYMLAGLSVVLFHDQLWQVLLASAVMGAGLGGVQNSTDALIADYFEGKQRSFVMGIYSTFVALGGILWTMLSGNLGAADWSHSYLAYLLMIVFIVVEAICLPKGRLEPKRKVNVFKNMPREVALITLISFIFVLTFQLFSTNVSLIVEDRGFGGVVEAGIASTVMTVAGIVAGLIVGPLFAKFKNLAMPITWCITCIGLVVTLVAPSLFVLCLAGFVVALGKESFVPLEGNFAAGNSNPEGRAFNLAIGMAGINFGMALSPLVFEAVTTPFGAAIDQKFIAGIVICLALAVFGFVRYRKLTPAQVAEQERMKQEAANGAAGAVAVAAEAPAEA